MTTKIEELQSLLSRLRRQNWGTSSERQQRQTVCWELSGLIEDLKSGRTPVLPSAAKYL